MNGKEKERNGHSEETKTGLGGERGLGGDKGAKKGRQEGM